MQSDNNYDDNKLKSFFKLANIFYKMNNNNDNNEEKLLKIDYHLIRFFENNYESLLKVGSFWLMNEILENKT